MARKVKDSNLSVSMIMAYLKRKGVPKNMMEEIRVALLEDAVVNGESIQYDRVFTAMGLMLKRCLGLDSQKILECLDCYDKINGLVVRGEKNWTELMSELEEETGIVIHTSQDRLICEYRAEEEVEAKLD